MKLTSNYNLKKPDGSDVVNVQDFNDNSDKIDLELNKVDSSLKEITNKVDNIKIADGTTAQKGIVQLNNTTNSTSITQAATANAVKLAMDRANEAFTSASNGKSYIAGKVGNVSGNNTFTQIGDRIQTDKNTMANNLNSKGIGANGNETLASLVGKIGNISLTGMGGRRFASGTTQIQSNVVSYHCIRNHSNGEVTFSKSNGILLPNIPFNPSVVLSVTNNGLSITVPGKNGKPPYSIMLSSIISQYAEGYYDTDLDGTFKFLTTTKALIAYSGDVGNYMTWYAWE